MRVANEARVGIVVVLALILMTSGYFFLRGIGFGADEYTIRLDAAATIAQGNDVRLQGIKVGTVKAVELDPETQKPLLHIAVRHSTPPFKLLKNYRYMVQSSAIIGENYVDIRGPFDPNGQTYAANSDTDIIPGTAAPGLAALTDSASMISEDLQKTLKNVNITLDRVNKGVLSYDNQIRLAKTLEGVAKLSDQAGKAFGPQGFKFGLGDAQAQRALNETLANTARASQGAVALTIEGQRAARNVGQLTNQAGAILNQTSGLIRDNRGELSGLLRNFSKTANNIAGLTETLTFLAKDPSLKENTQIALNSLRRSAENVEATTASFRRLSDNPENEKTIQTTLNSIRTASESLNTIATSIRNLVADTNSQDQLKGTLTTLSATATTLQKTTENLLVTTESFKGLVTDPQVQSDLKAIPTQLRGTLEATRATAERINALLGGRKRKNPDAAGSANPEKTAAPLHAGYSPGGINLTLRGLSRRDNNGDKYFGDVNFNSELFGKPFRAGISEIGQNTGLTLQSGSFLGNRTAIRYGLFRSKLGIGADYRTGKFSLEGDLYDLNRRSYAIYGAVRVSPNAEIMLGSEKTRGVRGASIGVRLTP